MEWGKFFRNILIATAIYAAVVGYALLAGLLAPKLALWVCVPVYLVALVTMLIGKRAFAHIFLMSAEAALIAVSVVAVRYPGSAGTGRIILASAILVGGCCVGIVVQTLIASKKKKRSSGSKK